MVMEVQVQSTKTITIPQQQEPVEHPLSLFDCYVPSVPVTFIFAFAPPTATNSTIIEGLSKTLLHFPTFTGRLSENGIPRIIVGGGDDEGVLVVETSVSSKLSDRLPFEPTPDLPLLHPSWDYFAAVPYLLQVQLNRFECGGLVVGITFNHKLVDGKSMGSFVAAWGKASRGIPIDPPPVFDQSWLKPRSPPRSEFEHFGVEFVPIPAPAAVPKPLDDSPIANVLLRFSSEFVARLKAGVAEKLSTFEVLSAHLWRKIAIARELDEQQVTTASVAINARPRIRPEVSPEYFGNFIFQTFPKMNVKDLVNGGVSVAARVIREAVSKIGDDYIRSFIDFMKLNEGKELVPAFEVEGSGITPDLEIVSWLGLRLQELDFGGGKLCGILPTWSPVGGFILFLPALRPEGGVDVLVGLKEEHAVRLTQISHTLMCDEGLLTLKKLSSNL